MQNPYLSRGKRLTTSKFFIWTIGIFWCFRGFSQEIQLIHGIEMLPPKSAVKLDKEQLKAFLHQEKFGRYFRNLKYPNIYKMDNMLVSFSGTPWNYRASLEKSKADWDERNKRFKQNPNYGSIVTHNNNYGVFVERYERRNSLIINFFALSNSHKLLMHGLIVYHKADSNKALDVYHEMLNNLKFTDNPELKDTVNLK